MPAGLDTARRTAARVAAIRAPYPGTDALSPRAAQPDPPGRGPLAPVVHLTDRTPRAARDGAERVGQTAKVDSQSRINLAKVLGVVADFLRRGGGTRLNVPIRERSFELFDDEKRLDGLLGTRLFTSGALSTALLRCHPVPMPFAAQWVSGATGDPEPGDPVTLLVAENHHTCASLLEATRVHAAAGGPGRHVGYGGGGQFCSAVASTPLLRPTPTRIVYFGDLDQRGLEIPATASGTARATGLPPVNPALPLYSALLAHGRPGPAGPVAERTAAACAAWLGPLAAEAERLLCAGQRLAQEAIGLELLMIHPEWLDMLADPMGKARDLGSRAVPNDLQMRAWSPDRRGHSARKQTGRPDRMNGPSGLGLLSASLDVDGPDADAVVGRRHQGGHSFLSEVPA